MYFLNFILFCYVKSLSTDMLEEHVSEEKDPDLNEEGGIRMEDSREYHWVYVAEDGEEKKNIHALIFELCKIYK